MFETSDDYHELNAGANRNSPENLHAPTLTWHLAFWIKKASLPEQSHVADVKTILDTFLLTLFRALQADDTGSITDVHLSPCISRILLLFNKAADESSLVQIPHANLTIRQNDILTSSSRAVSIRFKWHELCLTIRCEMHTEYFSVTTFAAVEKARVAPFSNLNELNATITEALSYFTHETPEKTGAVVCKLNKYFFRTFWDSYSDHVLGCPDVADILKNDIFKHVFADFRGIVFSDEAVDLYDKDFFSENKPPSWGRAAKTTFLPLLNIPTASTRRRQYECSVSYMLDGRALYMSALAPQLPDAPDDERIPLEFIVYVHQRVDNAKNPSVNKWELGRLVNQLHLLGTLRLAALKDLKLLRVAETTLSALDQFVQNTPVSVERDHDKAMDFIQTAHDNFNKISADFLKDARCGLTYRVARSRYYVAQFRSNVKILQIMQLDGDQPYDQFVERRLGAEFDFIDSLGRRYDSATSTMLFLYESYLSIQTNKIDEDTKRIDQDIRNIQRYGELALLAALVPYYVIHLLSLVVHEKYVPKITIILWSLFVVYAVYKFFKK